jgi:hypothetical protein
MLAFLSMHCGFSHRKFHKLRGVSTLNQKHLFVITSLSTTQFEYGVKFSMEFQIFRKIVEFILTLAVISPLFYAWGRASFKHGGGVITSSLTNAMWVLCCKRKKWKIKKIWYEEKKSKKKREEEREKKKEKNEKEIK